MFCRNLLISQLLCCSVLLELPFLGLTTAMLLIFPPAAKPCEPPAGIARLAAALQAHNIPCRLLDANLEAMLWLLGQPATATDTWTRRAAKHRDSHIAALREPALYGAPDRYRRSVNDLNRLLATAGHEHGVTVTLADYQDSRFSPLRSVDLIAAAQSPERNLFHPWFRRRLDEMLGVSSGEPVRSIGFSLNYLSQAFTTFAMIGHVRQRFPGLSILLGGGLVTSWMRRPEWQNPFGCLVDRMIAGPGEAELLGHCGCTEPLLRHCKPDYSQLPLADYLAPGLILPYSAAGGCYWNRCSFCPERAEQNPYHPLAVRQVLTDLRELTEAHRPAMIHLLDNAITPALLKGLVASPPGAPWYGFARFSEELADPEFCHELRRSGCVMLKLGLESGDQGVLDRLRKGIDLGTASRVLAALHRAGIATYIYLLFGTPVETETEARRTLRFVEEHHQAITFLNLAIFNMPSYGEEAAAHETEPFYDADLSLYTAFRHPSGWERSMVRRFLNAEFKRSPRVAAILRNDPPLFTSNHAPFLCSL